MNLTEKIVKEAVIEFQSKFTLQKALSILLNHKDWKSIVQQALSDKKDAKLTDTLLIAAVMFLSTFFQISSADELINKIEQTSTTQQVSDSVLVNKIENLLPYPVNDAELFALQRQVPFTKNVLINEKEFKKTLEDKVKKSIKKILPEIQRDNVLKNLDHEKLVDITLKSFQKKLEKPQYKDALAILNGYLTKIDKDMPYVYEIVKNTLVKSI